MTNSMLVLKNFTNSFEFPALKANAMPFGISSRLLAANELNTSKKMSKAGHFFNINMLNNIKLFVYNQFINIDYQFIFYGLGKMELCAEGMPLAEYWNIEIIFSVYRIILFTLFHSSSFLIFQ